MKMPGDGQNCEPNEYYFVCQAAHLVNKQWRTELRSISWLQGYERSVIRT